MRPAAASQASTATSSTNTICNGCAISPRPPDAHHVAGVTSFTDTTASPTPTPTATLRSDSHRGHNPPLPRHRPWRPTGGCFGMGEAPRAV